MLGWIILFALFVVPGVASSMVGYPGTMPLKSVSVVFALLLVASLLTRALRTRAR